MSRHGRTTLSERWFRLLLALYPPDFRDEFGEGYVETYLDRARDASARGGMALGLLWLRALLDSLGNGLAERVRPSVGWRRAGRWGRDTELVLRRLMRAPIFVVTLVGTLTVGLGAFAVVYTTVDKVLLAPLPYEDPEDLYFVWREYTWFDLSRGWLGGPDIAELDAADGVIAGAAGLSGSVMALRMPGADPVQLTVALTSPHLFDLLGVRPMLGRGFRPDEVGPERPPVLVLSHDLWRTRFGADPGVLDSEVRLDGDAYTVIGVMGPDFRFVRNSSLGAPQRSDAYIPFDFHLAEADPNEGSYAGLIRARPGAVPEAVTEAVAAVGRLVDERDHAGRGVHLWPVGMKDDLVSPVRPALVVLGLAGFVLVLVLAFNLATLLLVRGIQREREFAVARALGANRLALVRATLLEGGVLGMLGGAGGALVAVWGTRLLVGLAPLDLPRREFIHVDFRIAAVVIGVGTLLGLLAGAVPAVWATRTRLNALLQSASVRGGGGQGRLRRGMVVVQVALSLVLLSAGGLVVRSFGQLLRATPGFEQTNVLTFGTFGPARDYPDEASLSALHARIQLALSALPGVRAVGPTSSLPLSTNSSQTTFRFPGAPGNTGEEDHDAPLVDWIRTRPGYIDAAGIRLIEGRDLDPAGSGVREVLVDRRLVDTFFPGTSPIGYSFPFREDTFTVVGVVDHARLYDLHLDGRFQIYLNYDDIPSRTLSYAVRTERPPKSMVRPIRDAIAQIDPGLALADVQTMDEIVAGSLRQQRLSAVLIAGFSLGALFLAAMGLFGVVAGSVTRRRHELAIRLALGADHRRVIRLVLREGALLVLLGVLLGVPGIYFSGQAVQGLLVGISPVDPLTLGTVAAGLAVVAFAACYLPARRVASIDPARSLGQE